MDFVSFILMLAFAAWVLRAREQRQRIVLLASHLGRYQIEKLMEALMEGYLRALGESDAQRAENIWALLATTERNLAEQFDRFAGEFAQVNAPQARVSHVALPYVSRLFPQAGFDMREALRIHARGIAAAVGREDETPAQRRDRAFTMTAELMLMQHTCHWFCRSRTSASVRLLARHQTPHEQVVASVSPETRRAYTRLVGA